MSRYYSRRVKPMWLEDDLWPSDTPMIPDVCAPDHKPTDTGLLDKDGNPIMRAARPVGFGRMEEW